LKEGERGGKGRGRNNIGENSWAICLMREEGYLWLIYRKIGMFK